MTQLELFDGLKPIDYTSPIGMYSELKDIKGIEKLSDKGLECLHYLYLNHARPEDGFIHADRLAMLLGLFDTRQLRSLCAEIDFNTELVVYASQNGYKLASNPYEIREAIKFALAPIKTALRRTFAKSKDETLHWLHGFIGNLEKEFGGIVQGQQQIDENLEQREVNHFPAQPFVDYVAPIEDRIKNYKENKK